MAHEIQYLSLWDICSKSKSLTWHMHWPWMALYLADSEDNLVPSSCPIVLFSSQVLEVFPAGRSWQLVVPASFYCLSDFHLLPLYLFFMARVESFEK